jgi:endonuclease YncB( thermonuclease family)
MADFTFDHDFKKYPELSNQLIADIGFMSPHPQITEDFEAVVVKVHDGDTVTLRVEFRDFDFPLRFLSVDAPELNTGVPGEESRDWLKENVEGEMVRVRINKDNRVEKYGRLLGDLIHNGIIISDTMIQLGLALPFERRREGQLPDFNQEMAKNQWVS